MPEPLTIVVSATPNPHALKLTLNRTLTEQGKTFRDAALANEPWARALLSIPGVVGVYGINNFISINKAAEAEWETIVPKAEAGLRQALG